MPIGVLSSYTPYFTYFEILECLILHISGCSERIILQNILFLTIMLG